MNEEDIGSSAVPVPTVVDPLDEFPRLEDVIAMANLGFRDAAGRTIALDSIDAAISAIQPLTDEEMEVIRDRAEGRTLEDILKSHPQWLYVTVVHRNTSSRGHPMSILFDESEAILDTNRRFTESVVRMRDLRDNIQDASDRIDRDKSNYIRINENAIVAETHATNFVSGLPFIRRRDRAKRLAMLASITFQNIPSSVLDSDTLAPHYAAGHNPMKKKDFVRYSEKFGGGTVTSWAALGETVSWSYWVEMAIYFANLSSDTDMLRFARDTARDRVDPSADTTMVGVRILSFVMWHVMHNTTRVVAWMRREVEKFSSSPDSVLEEEEIRVVFERTPINFRSADRDDILNLELDPVPMPSLEGLSDDTIGRIRGLSSLSLQQLTQQTITAADFAYLGSDNGNGDKLMSMGQAFLVVRNLLVEMTKVVNSSNQTIASMKTAIDSGGSDVDKIQDQIGLIYTTYISNDPDPEERWGRLIQALRALRTKSLDRLLRSMTGLIALRNEFDVRHMSFRRDADTLLNMYKKRFGVVVRGEYQHANIEFNGSVATTVSVTESMIAQVWGMNNVLEYRNSHQRAALMGVVIQYNHLKSIQGSATRPTHMRMSAQLSDRVNFIIKTIGNKQNE